jgi:hypothetical protein
MLMSRNWGQFRLSPVFPGPINSNNSDNSGTCTLASTNSCTIQFARPWGNTPVCVASDQSRPAAFQVIPSATQLILMFPTSSVFTDTLAHHCEGNPN